MLLLSGKRKIIISTLFFLMNSLFSLQLGNGNDENQLFPLKIEENVKHVSASVDYTMIVKNDGSLWATGKNYYNQFGNLNYSEENSFVFLLDEIDYVATNSRFSVIIKKDKTLWIAGHYPFEITKKNELRWKKLDQFKKLDTDVSYVSIGNRHILYLKTDGSLWGIGNNDDGQLGLGKTIVGTIKPKKIQEKVKKIYADNNYSFYIDDKNDLYLSGSKTYFLDKDNKEIISNHFVKVFSDVKNVSTGLILKTNGDLYSFGYGCYGALGIGKEGSAKEPLTFVMHDVKDIAGSQEHSLVILKNGDLLSSGGDSHCNFGTIGDGTTKPSYSFVKIMENVKAASVGGYFSMVIKTDDTLWGFGVNNNKESGLSL